MRKIWQFLQNGKDNLQKSLDKFSMTISWVAVQHQTFYSFDHSCIFQYKCRKVLGSLSLCFPI